MNTPKGQQGFLMVDILLAVVIISVALVAILSMFIQSTKATHCSAGYTMASHLAQEQMELLKNTQSVAIKNTVVNSNGKIFLIPTDPKIALPTGFSMISKANQHAEFPNALAEVTVTVSWQEQNKSYNMPVTTFFSIKQ